MFSSEIHIEPFKLGSGEYSRFFYTALGRLDLEANGRLAGKHSMSLFDPALVHIDSIEIISVNLLVRHNTTHPLSAERKRRVRR